MLIPKSNNETLIYDNANWNTVVQPLIEPITVAELKLFARIDHDDEDDLLSGFIEAVRNATEEYLGRSLINRTILLTLDNWSCNEVDLPMPPMVSITSVTTINESDVETVYSSDNYFVDTNSYRGRIVIKNGVTPPINTDRQQAGYRITYVAGYGETADNVPQLIKQGIKLWATALYENRAIATEPPPEAINMMSMFKVVKL